MRWERSLPPTPRVPRPRSRAGLNLIEIMLATFVLAVVMIPILQLIFGGVKDTARGRDRSTAVALAANIMTQLIEKVPYSAFKPGEGPKALGLDDFFKSTAEEAGLLADKEQCLLEALDSDWERILDQDRNPGDGQRTVVKNGTTFEILLYAGTYQDDGSAPGAGGYNAPKLKGELTFSFFRNPHIEMTSAERAATRELVVDTAHPPYESEGTDIGVTRIDDPRVKPGWPGWPSMKDELVVDAANFYRGDSSTIGTEDPNEFPAEATLRKWPRQSLDLADFREETGALLKLVLGVRWRSGAGGGKEGGYARTTKEFWLVSFKAKLEEN